MNPIEEKENIENQEEHNQNEPKEENQEISIDNEKPKEGQVLEGDLLNLEAENESSVEAKDKDEKKDNGEEEEKPEKEKGEQSVKKDEEGNEEKEGEGEGEGEAEGEQEGEEGQNSDLDEEIKINEMKAREQEVKTREKTLESVKLQYKYKLSLIRKMDEFETIYDKFWDLLPKTFEGDISKESFISLISKILKILLPLFNHGQIPKYCEGIWIRLVRGRPTMTREIFEKVIFKLTHLMSVHVNSSEYKDTLDLIYDRITCIRKYYSTGEEKLFYPSIKVTLYNPLSKEEYQNCTWEIMNSSLSNTDLLEAFDENAEENSEEKNQGEKNEEEQEEKKLKRKVRPRLRIINDFGNTESETKEDKDKNEIKPNSYYECDKNMFLYSEDIFYPEKGEIDIGENEMNCHVKYELMDDNDLVIYGYPTQFILNKFINNMKDLEDVQIQQNAQYDSTFFITDYPQYEKRKIYLKILEKEKLIEFLKENTSFILIRDDFQTNPNIQLGADFSEDLLNIVNNLRRNLSFDRYFDIYEIKLPNNVTTKANLDHLIMNSTYQKAFGNVFDKKLNKIGVKSKLWSETIENKIETIIKTKFELIYIKLLVLNLNYFTFEALFRSVHEEKQSKDFEIAQKTDEDLNYFNKFKSKEGIKVENFDNENDLYDMINKKSPVVLIIGPPRVGKSAVSKKLAEDLNMVYLEPTKFFEEIFKKVADFEEKMLTWDEEHPKEEEPNPEENPEEGEQDETKKKQKKVKKEETNYLASWEPEPTKNVKPEVDSVLNEVELAVYNDLINGQGVSEQNMQRMYMYILHSDLAISRGVVIDMNSNITPESDDPESDSRSFVEKILTGFYGPVEVDYVVELTLDKNELNQRNNAMKFNLKTLQNISPRDIELMKKPKIAKKEILEDEIEYDEEGKQIIPEPEPEPELGEEELEKIPKDADLLEITNNEKIFKEQYDYYEDVQKPIVMDYVEKLKTNYYIPIDTSGLDFDDVVNLIKKKLDFIEPLRPIPRALEPGDFKGLLQDGREGVLPYRKWSQWKQIDPVALKDEFLILTGSTEFPAVYFGRVFLFVNEDNRKKFIENPKKYISTPPKVPVNYRISIIGPGKSGKTLIANMLSEIYGWRVIDMEEIYEKVKEYQKTWTEPEINSVYTRRVHFSANEFKEVLANASKKPSERKPDNFVSKIVFMLDSMGIPLDKKKTKEQFFAFRKYHRGKLAHMFNTIKEKKEREEFEKKEEEIRIEEEKAEQKRLEDEAKEEETLFTDMTECARSLYEVEKDKRAQVYADHVAQKEKEKEQRAKDLEEKEKKNPYPPEEDYLIEDLRSDQFFLAFDEQGVHPRVSGIILINHPFSDEECEKLKEFNIVMDRIIYIKDDTEEGIKALTERRVPNFNTLKEERQGEELEKTKAEAAKFEEVIGILKEKYNVNNEESVIEVGYNEPIEELKLKLENALNPFNIKIDQEDKVVAPSEINLEEKYPLSRGPFGLFCPVIYKEDNWLFYAPEANEVQVNQKVYRISGEKEMEKFRNNPAKYLGESGSLLPIEVPPPHIMITGYQGSGVTFYTNVLSKQYRLVKREIQKEFMDIWEKQRLERKEKRVQKKREELQKQNEEIEQRNADAKKENPEAEPEPLLNIEEVIKEDAALDEEGEDYNAVDNDKAIFKSLFNPLSPTIYDASWNGLEEKIATPFIDLLSDSRRVPNVMVVLKVTLKSIMDRLFDMEEIEVKYDKMYKESQAKRDQREKELIKQKKQEKYDELKAQYDEEQANEEAKKEQGENEEQKAEEGEGEPAPEKMKKPVLEEIVVELTPEEKDEIWNSPDPDLIEKEALIQQEKDKLSQRYEANVAAIQTLIDTLKERGVPVIEINNDTTRENVYTNLLLELNPYINNRRNLIEKQLVYNKEFPTPLSLRKVRDLYTNSEVYMPSVYNKLSPIEPSKLCIRTDYPIVYRDRVYLFNNPEEKKIFEEYPLDYRTGLECPKDSYPMKGRTIICTIGDPCSGKSSLADMMAKYMGYQKMTVDTAILDLIKTLKDCQLLKDIQKSLYEGKSTDDNLIIKIISRRITMEDLINENIVIDGFPYTLIQANLLPETLQPDMIFVAQCPLKKRVDRCLNQPGFDGIPEVVNERNTQLESHFLEILHYFKERNSDIRYFDMTKSRWFIKDQILELLQNRKKAEMLFSRNLSLGKPCLLSEFTPKKLIENIIKFSRLRCSLLMYSPVSLKTSHLFRNNKCLNNSWTNYIVYTPYNEEKMKLLREEEEKEKKFLEEIYEKAKEKRRKMREERLKKEREEQERKELFEKAERERIEREEREKKELENKENEAQEGQEGNEVQGENAENNELKEENKENEENKEEAKEINEEEHKENEEKKEEENKEEEKKEEEIKDGENKEENKKNNEEEQQSDDEKKEKGSSPKETKENMILNSDRTSNPNRESILEEKQSTAEEFKNIVMDTNFIMFHFLTNEKEVSQFMKNPDDYVNYILRIRRDIKPPMYLSQEKIAEILYQDKEEEIEENEEEENADSKEEDSELLAKRKEGLNKFSLNVKYEYQDCCPVDIVEKKIQKIGKVAYSMKYNGKYYKFSSMENMEKFKLNPDKYINLELPVLKVNIEQNKLAEKKILFNNTVNFLEFTYGSLITKGMLELSNNRIKYPYLNVKESSLKYLALFLKANNPKNNKYAQEKYKKILKEFKRNSELPWELYHVYENYNNEKKNELNKKLIRKQLDTVSVKYDKLMEKAKIQNNTRFANFFRIYNEANEEEKNE